MSVFTEKHPANKLVVLFITSAFLLTGCGIKGNLETPPPLWGEEKAESEPRPDDSILNESPLDDEQDDIFTEPFADDEST